MARTTFKNGIRVGKDHGASSLNTLGDVLLVQEATAAVGVSAGSGQAFRLPANATIHDIKYRQITAESSAGASHTIRVGTSADETFFGSLTVTNGATTNTVAVSAGAADNWIDLSNDTSVFVDVTAAASAGTQLSGILSIQYYMSS